MIENNKGLRVYKRGKEAEGRHIFSERSTESYIHRYETNTVNFLLKVIIKEKNIGYSIEIALKLIKNKRAEWEDNILPKMLK